MSCASVHGRAFSPESVVIGQSPRMRAIFDFVRVIADSESNVLITGETGTGKEVIANLIHHLGRRRARPFVPVSCAIFSDTLIESELFGHERGAFTGATTSRPGRFELAQGGTIFLDDIDDVPLSMQVKLLRVLQHRTIERLGGTRAVPVDVRVITGSKRDLRPLITDKKFREDLYYRLHVVPIMLPPLRERREDIPILMHHFLTKYFHQRDQEPPPVSGAVIELFMRYSWPGNVRELENVCERMTQTYICDGLRMGCVPGSVLFSRETEELAPTLGPAPKAEGVSLDDHLRGVEASLIRWALTVSRGNKSKAADLLKIRRSTLGDRIKRLGQVTLMEDQGTMDTPAKAADA